LELESVGSRDASEVETVGSIGGSRGYDISSLEDLTGLVMALVFFGFFDKRGT
jgi:hypothetical protein